MALLAAAAVAPPGGGRAAAAQDIRHEYVELHLGVAVRLVLYAPSDTAARAAARAAFDRIAELEDIMSDYRPASEVRRLAALAGQAVPVSAELLAVLARALEIARLTDGAFDPTVGPMVALWRDAQRTGTAPARAALDSARALVGWSRVHLDSAHRTVRLGAPGMRLDLGGIAKGYILDRALAELRRRGLTRALLEAGGDLVVGDPPPGAPGWRVAVADPSPELERQASALANAALATSESGQVAALDGVRRSSVVDPHTGVGPVTRRRATVVAADGATADALATALTVLEPGRAAVLARRAGVVAAVVRDDSSDR